MTGTYTTQDNGPGRSARRITWHARALLLGGLALAAVYNVAVLVLGAGAEHVSPLWMAAIAWTVAASLAGALWRGFRHSDWSASSGYELPEDDGEMEEWAMRTGRYAWLRDMEEELLRDNEHLR